MSQGNKDRGVVLDDSLSSGRESGECTPSPVGGDGTDDDVVIVETVIRNAKKARSGEGGGQMKSSAVNSYVLLEEGPAVNSSTDSIQLVESEGDSEFVLDTTGASKYTEQDSIFFLDATGTVEAPEADSMFILDTTGKPEDTEKLLHSPEISFGNVDLGESRNRTNGKHTEKVFDMSVVLTFAGTPESASDSKQESLRKMNCFNCGGNHTLDKCDIPHDARRIAKNKSAHYNNKRQSTPRYTCDTEITSYRPGEVSKELRTALGIGANDIPEWIYRMRRMGFVDGYPPAYLKQAIEGTSDSVLEFHMEDSSFQETPSGSRPKLEPRLNRDKMFQYPGFNVYRPKLNDREKPGFRVPTFSAFFEYHQRALSDKTKEETKAKEFSPNKRRSHRRDELTAKKARNDDDDVEILEDESEDEEPRLKPSCSTPRLISPRLINMENEGKSGVFQTPLRASVPRTQSSPALLGTSFSKCSGTPQGAFVSTSNSKPDLEKFREGIVPFEAREDVNLQRGFFKNLMKLIKKNSGGN